MCSDKMSHDGDYEEQTDGDGMKCFLNEGEQPLPTVSIMTTAGNAGNEPPAKKDPKLWNVEEKRIQRIDCLAKSLLIQMRDYEYSEQDRKAVILYEYETFKATEGDQLLDTYLRYLQVINNLKKYGYKKDNCNVNDVVGIKKKAVVVTSYPLALVAEKTKDQVWMELSSGSDQELSANMVFMAKMEKILSDLEESSSFVEETTVEVPYYSDSIVQICLWIFDSGYPKHMTGNRALLKNFVEKFFKTVRFDNDDFVVIAGYGDVVIGSMTIKKVYYVE
nr:integrase, catalytic region, zinc finger, CCHC-type, peptidase aspartic, catalytic [Tanacetum cinerariifolium]